VLGVLLTFMLHHWPASRYARSFATIGFLGAYTTFSTYVVEADVLAIDGHVGVAAVYVVASLVAGLVAAWIGITLGRLTIPRVRTT
jgi:CrcB protein